MAACRALLYTSCSSPISLPALSDAAFIATMRALGLGELDADQLVSLKTHNVDADFIHELADMGLIEPHEKSPESM